MKNPITKLTCIAILALTTLTGFKTEGIKPSHLGKWKLGTIHATRSKHDLIIWDTIIEPGQKTSIFHFKDATNLDISETDETGTINNTKNYTYEIHDNYISLYGGEPNYEEIPIGIEFDGNKFCLTTWYYITTMEDGDLYYETSCYNKM
jgi:hypothetical protein